MSLEILFFLHFRGFYIEILFFKCLNRERGNVKTFTLNKRGGWVEKYNHNESIHSITSNTSSGNEDTISIYNKNPGHSANKPDNERASLFIIQAIMGQRKL